MRFTIGLPGKLLRAKYVIYLGHFEFDDGCPPLKKSRRGSLLECLRREFPDSWIMDQHGRSYPPLSGGNKAT